MKQSLSGSCLCGSVTFRISGEIEAFYLCHCSRCRKDSGSAHSSNLFLSGADVSWLSGYDTIRTYRLPGTRHEKSFCPKCSSALPSIQADGAMAVVPAGSLDSELDCRPTARICLASRAKWSEGWDEVEEIAGLPG